MSTTPAELIDSLGRFREIYDEPRAVGFLMMRFTDSKAHVRVLDAVKTAFAENGITLVRADEREFSPDLFTNVLTYMHGCGLGVAVFDRIESDEFNPNVSLEVGYMMALGKPVCFLKDRTLRALHADIVGRLYINIDLYEPSEGLRENVHKWIESHDLSPLCSVCSVEVNTDIPSWDTEHLLSIVSGFELFARAGDRPRFKGMRSNTVSGNAVLDFDATKGFCKQLTSLFERGDLDKLAGLKILNVESQPHDRHPVIADYVVHRVGGAQEEYLGQFCFLAAFGGWEHLAHEASKVLPEPTTEPTKCAIYITRAGDMFYFQSNFICRGRMYPTKLILKKLNGLRCVLPLIIEGPNSKGDVTQNDKLLLAHVRNVRYIFNRAICPDERPPFDVCGASRIEFVDF